MKILVTGAAGFIGSHLCEQLLTKPTNEVLGVDTFIGPTPEYLKRQNIKNLMHHTHFQLIEADLLSIDLESLLHGVDVIYHLAGMPGVRSSWGKDFDPYVTNNILVTQRLLEAVKNKPMKKFIYASTSSVYGEKTGKVSEDAYLTPLSPYGITKLTGEHLCQVYMKSYNIPLIIVRFFTVYGPRQRPDMAFHRFIAQILQGKPVTIFGDGTQSRDFTYISDCINGLLPLCYQGDLVGQTINIGGKERATVNEVIAMIEDITQKKANFHFSERVSGEPTQTWADISNAEKLVNYNPKIMLKEGLTKEVDYIRSIYGL